MPWPNELKMYFQSAESMHQLRDRSVALAVTSPPYNVARHYGKYNDDRPENEYFLMLLRVFKESYRVLRDDGLLFLNIANNRKDQFKSHQVASAACKAGFCLNDTIIWHKTNPIPSSDPYLTNRYEYIFVLSKHEDLKKTRFSKLDISTERIGNTDQWGRKREQPWRDPGNVWHFPVVKQGSLWDNDDHEAMFPPDLPRLAILSSTKKGETVLDPFMGSGTTAQVSLFLKRKCIGFEINADLASVIKKKLAKTPEFNLKIRPDIVEEARLSKKAA